MRRAIGAVLLLFSACVLFPRAASCQEEETRYARCNLKVLKGNQITWVNWQSAPTFIPAGTKLLVRLAGDRASLVNPATKATYTLEVGGDADLLLDKFLVKKPVDVKRFPPDVQANIRNAVAKVGMTKEQVYIAMGPPSNLDRARTNGMLYEDIMAGDLWVYARRRFGKNIGVAFDPGSGRVNRTEGIWGK